MDLHIGNISTLVSSSGNPIKQSSNLRHACQEFESVFISYMMKSMRQTVQRSEFMSGGFQEDIYLSMMDEEIARAVARGPGIGLADALYRQISESKNI